MTSAAADASTSPTAAPQAERVTPKPSPYRRPAWLRISVGTQAYTRATIPEDDPGDQPVYVCSTRTQFADLATSAGVPIGCRPEPAGTIVRIHKVRQDPLFGIDAIYVIAKTWSGLVEDDKIVPILPGKLTIFCSTDSGVAEDVALSSMPPPWPGDRGNDIGPGYTFKLQTLHTAFADGNAWPACPCPFRARKGKGRVRQFSRLILRQLQDRRHELPTGF